MTYGKNKRLWLIKISTLLCGLFDFYVTKPDGNNESNLGKFNIKDFQDWRDDGIFRSQFVNAWDRQQNSS